MSASQHILDRSPSARYLRTRRLVYHMLGGDGRKDILVRAVDAALMVLISVNCVFSILESVDDLAVVHGHIFHTFDRISVAVFTVEYGCRVWTAVEMQDARFHHPLWGRLRYMATPMALIDLVAVIPFYLNLVVEVDLRSMRVLRLMRVFKLTRYSHAMGVLLEVLRREARALGALLFVFMVILIFVSSLIYMVEHPYQPKVFSDVPKSMWWAVVTMTTLGYGDMVPITALGRMLGACTAVIGVGMVAVPAGILASGFGEAMRHRRERYIATVGRMAAEGRLLSPRERRKLEEAREALGISQAEAARIVRNAGTPGVCPHCGHPLD